MLEIENLSYSYPQKDLYQEISFSVCDGQHCAFIGSNGCGKTTLLHMIAEPEAYLYDGRIRKPPSCRIGYVRQNLPAAGNEELSVMDYISQPFVKQQEVIDEICRRMEQGEYDEDLLERYQTEWDRFTAMGGDHYETEIRKRLKAAGIETKEKEALKYLSGGEQRLVQLIREMLIFPDLLILDEPDAFLDFENQKGLKNLIQAHKGAMIVVSHDRFLLKECFDKILHLENGTLLEYEGTYPEYRIFELRIKTEQMELAQRNLVEIERNRLLVERLRKEATMVFSASRGKTLHARVSLLERLVNRKQPLPFLNVPLPEIHFTGATVLEETETVLSVQDYQICYEETLLDQVSFSIMAGEKVAIAGKNGTGKTTLLRDVYERNSPAFTFHPGILMGYLSQRPEDRHEEGLSGGERNLQRLKELSEEKVDFLLLDEPGAHLDLDAKEIMERAIREFPGTVLLVSHDFFTIANCADYVLWVENRTVKKISGRKFRKMIYASYFTSRDLEKDTREKQLEDSAYAALRKGDTQKAKGYVQALEEMEREN